MTKINTLCVDIGFNNHALASTCEKSNFFHEVLICYLLRVKRALYGNPNCV